MRKFKKVFLSVNKAVSQRNSYVFLGATLLLELLYSGHALAAEENDVAQENSIEIIKVTARRVGESIQDVPQTVNAVDTKMMEKLNLINFEDIGSIVSGLTLSNEANGFSTSATLRGVSFAAETAATPTVDFYMNDTPIGSNVAFQAMYDMGQIEVLSGPQGTLRGRSAPSGAISLVTRKPHLFDMEGYVNVSLSNINSSNYQGALNIPLIDNKLAIRIAGLYSENDLNGVKSLNNPSEPNKETKSYRASVYYAPTEDIDLYVTYQKFNDDNRVFGHIYGTGATAEVNGVDITNGPMIEADDRLAISDGVSSISQDNELLIAQFDWNLGGHVFSYIGSHSTGSTFADDPRDIANWIPQAEIYRDLDTDNERNVHELRLSSNEKIYDLFDYTVGFFYFDESFLTQLYDPVQALAGALGSPLEPQGTEFNPRFVVPLYIDSMSDSKEYSIFANVTVDLSENTELSVGARYMQTNMERSTGLNLGTSFNAAALPMDLCIPSGIPAFGIPPGEWEATYANVCDLVATTDTSIQNVADEVDENNFIYNISLSHRINPDLMVYATTGSSWRAGPNIVGLTAEVDEEIESLLFLDPEKSTSYEIGFKSTFDDKNIRLNAAVFHQDFKDYFYYGEPTYFLSSGADPFVNYFSFTSNADAIVNGIDIDLIAYLTADWHVNLGFSYAKSAIDDDLIPCTDTNADGIPDNDIPTVETFIELGRTVAFCSSDASISTSPNWKSTAMSEYFFGLNESLEGYVRALFTYSPKNSNSKYVSDGYGLLNLYAGVINNDSEWEVGFYAKNILNKQQILTADTNQITSLAGMSETFGDSGYSYISSYTPRRELGVTFRYNFN